MTIENCFAIPIYHVLVENFISIQQEFKTVIDTTNFKHVEGWDNNAQLLSDTEFVTSIFKSHNLKSFENELDKHIKEYAKSINLTKNIDTYDIAQSWITLTKPGQYAHRHSHGYSDISGVYYIQTNSNDGDFWTENPLSQLFETSYFYSHIPERIYTRPQAGRLILFPSWLKHGVDKNTTNEGRISCSFNIFFNRTLHLNKRQ